MESITGTFQDIVHRSGYDLRADEHGFLFVARFRSPVACPLAVIIRIYAEDSSEFGHDHGVLAECVRVHGILHVAVPGCEVVVVEVLPVSSEQQYREGGSFYGMKLKHKMKTQETARGGLLNGNGSRTERPPLSKPYLLRRRRASKPRLPRSAAVGFMGDEGVAGWSVLLISGD